MEGVGISRVGISQARVEMEGVVGAQRDKDIS